jgi:outer membrane protein insertion porin family
MGLFSLLLAIGAAFVGHATDDKVLASDTIQVFQILFEGNDSYTNLVLKDIIATEQPGVIQRIRMHKKDRWYLDQEELARDLIRIERFYRRRGFVDPKISYRLEDGHRKKTVRVVFAIQEGAYLQTTQIITQWQADSLTKSHIENSTEYTRAFKRQPLKINARFEPILEAEMVGSLNTAIRNEGYAFSHSDLTTSIDTTKRSVVLTITHRPGPVTRLDSIIIEGETTAKEELILKEANLHVGDRFSQRKLDDAQYQLFSHHLFRLVTLGIPEQKEDSTLTVSIRLLEHPLRKVEVMAGAGNRELLRTQITWEHRNALQKLHNFSVNGRITFISQRLSLDYLMPYVANTNSLSISSTFLERRLEPAFLLRRGGIKQSYIYLYGLKFTSTLSYTFTGNKLDVFNTRSSLPPSVEEYTISALEMSALYADERFTLQRGWVVRPSLELSGLFGTGDYEYQKLYFDARRYLDVTPRMQLALRGTVGYLLGAMADSLPPSILFYGGGYGSVRGWYQNQLGPKRAQFDDDGKFDSYVPTGGRYLFEYGIESRFGLDALIPKLGLSTFVDGGQVWKRWPGFPESGDRSIQSAVGIGVYYITPVGPLRLDIARKINPKDEDLNRFAGVDYGNPIDRWGFHFSLGQSF